MTDSTYEYILEHCKQEVARAKRIALEGIGPETTFESLGLDSLDMINVSFEIEEHFHVEIPDDALSSIRTMDDMARGVAALVAAKATAEAEGAA